MTVQGERTVRELRGESCVGWEEVPVTRQCATCSRSFGQPVATLVAMEEAVATFVATAAERIRGEALACGFLTVFAHTNTFRPDQPQYSNSASARLAAESDDTRELTALGLTLLRRIYREGFGYKKAGVMLTGLVNRDGVQRGLFDGVDRGRSAKLMGVMDQVNAAWGRGTLRLAAQGVGKGSGKGGEWEMRRDRLSPRYTTSWGELLVARA